jgi:hypothetical protein
MKIEGACHCGAITFEAEVDPEQTSICHCTDCQTLSGSPFRASVTVPHEKFRIVAGEPAVYVKTAESGNKRAQGFCRKCGSPIYTTALGDSSAPYNIRLGVVKQRDQLVPKRQIWTRSRQSWIEDVGSLPAFEKGVPR